MLVDLSSGSGPNQQFHADVCVCGAGPSGITIARTLANSGKSVVLVEAGGIEPSEFSQELYQG